MSFSLFAAIPAVAAYWRRYFLLFLFGSPFVGTFSSAHSAETLVLDEIVVSSNRKDLVGVAESASEGTVNAKELEARPLLRPAEVMETVPGMIVTQHSGDGKANQYFLRGFNLDHGSDFATYVNGMPVNNLSHAHGQGYTDLNFLIPELVDNLRYRKGMYAAGDGDLAVTGSARIDYARTLAAHFLDISVGENGYRRSLAAGSKQFGDINLLAAVELAGNDGPWEQLENLAKRNAVLSISSGTPSDGYALTAMAYDADWTATEQVPERAITNGEIGRFGTLAPTDGGKTHRYSLSGEWAEGDDHGSGQAHAYVVDYGLNLFSTPSGLLTGQHEQADQRIIWGGDAERSHIVSWGGKETEATLGVQFRQDRIGHVGLFQTTDRQRTGITREDRIMENSLGLYVEARTQWLPWLRSTMGLRWDKLMAEVTPLAGVFNSGNGGNAGARQLSPKLGVAFGPFGHTEYYANWGQGFHSNDARGATSRINVADGTPIAPTPLIVKATGGEVGLRTQVLPGWHSSFSLWRMKLASELVFIGDEGVTEPKGSSRRYGLEWSNDYNRDGLYVDGDLALAHARFDEASNGGTHVPNAIPLTASLGANLDRGGAWFGGVRFRYLGSYPLEETGTEKSMPFWTANIKFGYRVDKSLQFSLDVLNLFDRKANDIEYWGSSCTATEGAACNGGNGIDGRMIHPLEPRTMRLGMRVNF